MALLVGDKVKSKKFNNSKPGFKKLLSWIDEKQIKLSQACMEATGIYGQALAEFLFDNNIPISVVNPARIKGFSQSELARSKNDSLDAKLIARFCKLIRPSLFEPTPALSDPEFPKTADSEGYAIGLLFLLGACAEAIPAPLVSDGFLRW